MPVSLNYQRGMALLVSLVGMVLLGLIGMARGADFIIAGHALVLLRQEFHRKAHAGQFEAGDVERARIFRAARQHDGVAQEGGEGAFLAQIEIPARSYVDEEGPLGEDEQPTIVRSPVPFDPNRVALTLWPTN